MVVLAQDSALLFQIKTKKGTQILYEYFKNSLIIREQNTQEIMEKSLKINFRLFMGVFSVLIPTAVPRNCVQVIFVFFSVKQIRILVPAFSDTSVKPNQVKSTVNTNL